LVLQYFEKLEFLIRRTKQRSRSVFELQTNQARCPRAIVADDDPLMRALMANRLAQLGCSPLEAEEGFSAWRLMQSQECDLALIDLDMPRLNGFELIQCVRGHPRTKHLPIIVITSRNDSHAIEQALAAGATAFLTKPIQWSTFSHHIKFLLRLTDAANQARSESDRLKASCRAKDAVIEKRLRTSLEAATRILSAAERLLAAVPGQNRVPELAGPLEHVRDEALRIREGLSMTIAYVLAATGEAATGDAPAEGKDAA
jgi:CheY-like chemotaxis protein